MRTLTALFVGFIIGTTGLATAATTGRLVRFHNGQVLVNTHITCVAAQGGVTCSSDRDKGKSTYQATVLPDGNRRHQGQEGLVHPPLPLRKNVRPRR
jgi:hypothetical protein